MSTGASGTFLAGHEDNLSRQRYRALMNVTGLTVGTKYDLNFAFTNVANHNGIAKLSVLEVPIATVDVVRHTAEIGIEAASFYRDNPIATNLTTSPRGMARFLAQIDRARKDNKRQWQICTSELDAAAFQTSSAAYANLMVSFGLTNPTYRMRARRLYKTTDNNVYTLAIRYRVSGGATAAFQVKVNGASTTITGLAGAAYGETTTALNVPCNGANDQEVTLEFTGGITAGAGTFYVSRILLVENES